MLETVRKTFQEQVRPTLQHTSASLSVSGGAAACATTPRSNNASACRARAAQPARATSRNQQEAELPELRAAFPDDAALQSPGLQDGLARRDRTAHAFFRRLQRGEKAGFPRLKPATRYTRFQPATRYTHCTFKE